MKARRTKFTVPEVYRSIVKKNEKQAGGLYDILVCGHAVPANDNTYRAARACPECRIAVQAYADSQRTATPRPPENEPKASSSSAHRSETLSAVNDR